MKRHQLDPWSLIGGVFLTGMGLLFLIPDEPLDLTASVRDVFGWALPILVVLVGIALIAPALRRKQDEAELPPSPPDPFDPIDSALI